MSSMSDTFPYADHGLLGMILGHWAEPEAFLTRLQGSPHAAARAHGIEIPCEVEIRFVANGDGVFHLRRPPARDSEMGRRIAATNFDPQVFDALCGVMKCPLRSWSPIPLDDLADQYQALLVATRTDEVLLRRYVEDPWTVLAEHGVSIPRSVPLKVLVDRPDLIHMVLPAPPSATRLAEFLGRFPPARSVTNRGAEPGTKGLVRSR